MTALRSVPADASQLALLNQFLREFWTTSGLAPVRLRNFELALEEIFINIVSHGTSPDVVPQVSVSLSLGPDVVTMTIEDDGAQFDPLAVPPPDLSTSLADRGVGGLGVYLVRRVMDTVSYARVAGRNQLHMSKRLDG